MSIVWNRFFTTDDEIAIPTRSVTTEIKNDKGKIIFQQENVKIPSWFSDRAANIIANQYFRGHGDTRENSYFDVVDRVTNQILWWADEEDTFESPEDADIYEEELKHLLINQMVAFNSPVWYNLGVKDESQQGSACFIGDVEDDMESISDRQSIEARVFKWGSGFGANNSKLRGSNEPLSNGGYASGPVSFMLVWDANAEVVRSAGKRRAAKMELLDVDHPDIIDFITCKGDQEQIGKFIKELTGATAINQTQIRHQNANHSVVVNDNFMQSCQQKEDWALVSRNINLNSPISTISKMIGGEGTIIETIPANDILDKIAHYAWMCGDPGLFFIDNINKWNTVPSWGKIVSCNPCAEFVQPPWSACNLASLNLSRFFVMKGDHKWKFEYQKFCAAVSTITLAMDLIAARADYPDKRIAENSRKYRPLGIGFTDLGAMLVKMGIPYDSDKAREIAAAITATMSASAWITSSKIQRNVGGEPRFPKEDVVKVLRKHSKEVLTRVGNAIMPGLCWDDINRMWKNVVMSAIDHGVSNSQVTLLAPTGTISFMMDCESTGVEPLVMLGGNKKMADTGVLHFAMPSSVNTYLFSRTIIPEDAYKDDGKGGLTWNLSEEIIKNLRDERVLDTAIGGMGMHAINYMGHIKMMAAVQPYLSGAISKTVNLPNTVTENEIRNLYLKAWQLGLKSIAVYRDGSKFEQPLNTVDTKIKETLDKTNGLRLKLPDTRVATNHKFQIGEQSGYLNMGFYPDGRLGEIFINMAKQGSTVRGLLDWCAVLTSICLQYGVPLEDLVKKGKGVKFEPNGITANRDILFAQSPIDYIFRYLERSFLIDEEDLLPIEETIEYSMIETTGNPCSACGTIMQRHGNCMYCDNCDMTTGCS